MSVVKISTAEEYKVPVTRAALPSIRTRVLLSSTYPQLRHTEEHVKYSSGKKELWAIWSSGISPLNRSLRAYETEKNGWNWNGLRAIQAFYKNFSPQKNGRFFWKQRQRRHAANKCCLANLKLRQKLETKQERQFCACIEISWMLLKHSLVKTGRHLQRSSY